MTQTQTQTQSTTITLRYGKGYRGKLGERCYVARITGTDRRFGLARHFVEPASVQREHFNRGRTIIEFSYELEAEGLYEISEEGDRWIVGCIPQKDGSLRTFRLNDATINAWVAALDAGLAPKEARRAGRAAGKAAQA